MLAPTLRTHRLRYTRCLSPASFIWEHDRLLSFTTAGLLLNDDDDLTELQCLWTAREYMRHYLSGVPGDAHKHDNGELHTCTRILPLGQKS
jgi:hypothetical protein